jgi:protein tyrosine/serine phosphatase
VNVGFANRQYFIVQLKSVAIDRTSAKTGELTGASHGVLPIASQSAKSGRRRTRWVIAAIAILIGVIAANHRQVTALRDRFIPKRWGVVEEGKIYRSGQLSRQLVRETLEAHGIQTVVDLTWDDPSEPNHVAELAAIAERRIERKLCPLQPDGTGDVHIYAQAVAAVARAAREGKPVLVHCAAGTQRTGGVVAFYRLLVEGKSPEFTFAEMRKYHYDPRHSPKLLRYVNEHIAEIAEDLVRDGIIERIPAPLPRLSAN